MTTLVWFRDDLRLADHPALADAAERPGGIVALYLLDEVSPGARPLGGAARWWLHGSLERLRENLAQRGIPLILRRGGASTVLPEVIAEAGADTVRWNRRYGAERRIDADLKQELRAQGLDVHSFQGNLLFEPGSITTGEGHPYRVYSPFWRACLASPAPAAPLPEPAHLRAAPTQPASDELEGWRLRPDSPDWASGLDARWTPGEAGALAALDRFLDERAGTYERLRDRPAVDTGSELSPHLRWGEISPRTVWHRSLGTLPGDDSDTHSDTRSDTGAFLSEVGWREFAWHTLFAHTDLHDRALDRRFDTFPWRPTHDADVASEITAWQRGETGFPLVDAGMRELWVSGFMHNRVRMVVASFLAKNLLVDWRVGEAWFWDTLVDADAASNPFNWQWVAGCGADAAPYFRVFNPSTQLQKFDPARSYADRWARDSLLYPELVDLRETRVRALAAFDTVKQLPRS